MKTKNTPQEAQVPLRCLNFYQRKYPGFIGSCDNFLRERKKDPKLWPIECFAPMGRIFDKLGAYLKERKVKNLDQELQEAFGQLAELSAVVAWSKTQDVFVIDQDLLNALIDSEIAGDLPVEVLKHMSAWSIYVKFPPHFKLKDINDEIDGFFSYFEYDQERLELELRFVIELNSHTHLPLILHLGEFSLGEAIERTYLKSREKLSKSMAQEYDGLIAQYGLDAVIRNITPFLNVLLYLCSKEPDLEGPQSAALSNSYPHLVTTRQGAQIIQPNKVTIVQVGAKIGEQLRKARENTEQSLRVGANRGTPKRTHVRRAHWHFYWTGPKNLKPRTYTLHWLSFMVINDLDKIEKLEAE